MTKKTSVVLTEKEQAFAVSGDKSVLRFGFEQETVSFCNLRYRDADSISSYCERHTTTNWEAVETRIASEIPKTLESVAFTKHCIAGYIHMNAVRDFLFRPGKELQLDSLWFASATDIAILEAIKPHCAGYVPSQADNFFTLYDFVHEIIDKHNITAAKLFPNPTEDQKYQLHESARRYILRDFKQADYQEYIGREIPFIGRTPEEVFSHFAKTFPETLEIVSDGSVSGPEIRPKKPLSLSETEQAVSELFRIPMKVDTTCSFHVHVSIADNQFRYDKKLQFFMMEYIVANLHRVPQNCIHRWMNVRQSNKYFPFQTSTAKYAFVSYSQKYHTWEFRCFGNITNATDAMACVNLASDALRHAFRRSQKQVKGIVAGSGNLPLLHLREAMAAFIFDEEKDVRKTIEKVVKTRKEKAGGDSNGRRNYKFDLEALERKLSRHPKYTEIFERSDRAPDETDNAESDETVPLVQRLYNSAIAS